MSDVTHIFWTGGWDSTFRVMELLTFTDRPIQPHYVVDPRRRSAPLEIETMQRLTRHLKEAAYAEESRIREPILYRRAAIPFDRDIDDAFLTISEQHRLGNQYRWLAMLAVSARLDGVELCVERGSLYPIAAAHLVHTRDDARPTFRIADNAGAVGTLLGPFSFPLIERNDARLREQATARGWQKVLAGTCFCHSPVRGHHPCGTCRPCILMLERKGESARVGLIGKARYWTIERLIRALPSALEWRCRQWQENHAVRKLHEQ